MKIQTNTNNISLISCLSSLNLFNNIERDIVVMKRPLEKDKFELNNPKLSFKGLDGPSESTISYINKIREHYKYTNQQLASVLDFNPNKIKDICAGIDIFKGWDSKDLIFATNNFDSILLHRGCYKQCTHCGPESNKKLVFMNWDNFTELADGIGILTQRLGFNPFIQDKVSNSVYPFHDSDPIDFRSFDSRGSVHNIFDATKYFHNKTGTKFVITTAGWLEENKVAKNSVNKFLYYNNCIKNFNISIHPFHTYMEKSISLKRIGDIEKSTMYRKKYINMAANNIATIFPLIKKGKGNIILEYTDSKSNKESDYTYSGVVKLLQEILLKVKNDYPELKFEYLLTSDAIENLDNQYWISIRNIQSKGRGENILGVKPDLYDVDAENLSSENILNLPKFIDYDGNVLVNLTNDNLRKDFARLPIRLNFNHTPINNSYTYKEIPKSSLVYNTCYEVLDRDLEINA